MRNRRFFPRRFDQKEVSIERINEPEPPRYPEKTAEGTHWLQRSSRVQSQPERKSSGLLAVPQQPGRHQNFDPFREAGLCVIVRDGWVEQRVSSWEWRGRGVWSCESAAIQLRHGQYWAGKGKEAAGDAGIAPNSGSGCPKKHIG